MEERRRILDISKEVEYPKEFYSFANGVDISNPEINRWIRECFETLRLQILKDPTKSHHSYSGSGNTIVILWAYPQSDGTFEVEFTVSKNYSTYSIFGFDPLVDEGFEEIK